MRDSVFGKCAACVRPHICVAQGNNWPKRRLQLFVQYLVFKKALKEIRNVLMAKYKEHGALLLVSVLRAFAKTSVL